MRYSLAMGRGDSESANHLTATGPASRSEDSTERGRLISQQLLRDMPLAGVPGEVALLSLAGSRAYGLERPDSDWDIRGVYAADLKTLLSLGGPQPTVEGGEHDLVVFELGRLFQLGMKANPNIFEILWAPPLYQSDLGRSLQSHKHLFLSQHLRVTYAGFAISQKKLIARHLRAERLKHAQKAALHALRLLDQGAELLRRGDFTVRVDNAEELKERSQDPERVAEEMDDQLERFDQIPSDLPERADERKLNEALFRLRCDEITRASRALRDAGL